MGPDDIVGGGEIALYRLIGRIVGGDTDLPTIEELTALEVPALETLLRLMRRALKSDLSADARAALRDFLRARLDKAVRIKFSKTMARRARALNLVRLPAFEALFRAKVNEDRLVGGGDAATEARAQYDRHAAALGEGHVEMVGKQAAFAMAQSGLSPEQVLLVLRAITLVEVAIDRTVAEAYLDVYTSVMLIEDSAIAGDGAKTDNGETRLSPAFLGGRYSLVRTAIILVHELVHVEQGGRKSMLSPQQILEGRAYGIDWHMSISLSDKERTKATITFMGGGLTTVGKEVAEYCVACVATHVLNRLRKEAPVANLPATLNRTPAKAQELYVEMLTKVPRHYSVDLDGFLLSLSGVYRAGALGHPGWIRRIPRLARYCTEKRFGSTLFERIEEGDFGAAHSEDE